MDKFAYRLGQKSAKDKKLNMSDRLKKLDKRRGDKVSDKVKLLIPTT